MARGLRRFQRLMPQRVRNVLLVSSLYDSFILTEDGHVNDVLLRQYADLSLQHNPDITRVSTGAEAIEQARTGRYDLVISSLRLGDMDATTLARLMREGGVSIPIAAMAYDNRALTEFLGSRDPSDLDRVFLWQGDARILLAIIKDAEDQLNVEQDTGERGVPAIIVVEDNVRYYSSFLPMIYWELVIHTRHLVSEGLNLRQKQFRTRARPKVLLCTNFEEAWDLFRRYEPHILGLISDIEFPVNGKVNRRAGVDLTERVRQVRGDIPVVLQSSIKENAGLALEQDAMFLLKGSPTMLHELREILAEHFGFGDFVFRMPDRSEVDRAHDLDSLVRKLRTVPLESLAYHGERNHFSMWLKARTEFALANELRARKVEEYPTLEALRDDLIESISTYRRQRDIVVVADFDRGRYDSSINIYRIGAGSLGGKARGLAFANRLLSETDAFDGLDSVKVEVPKSVVLATDVFDEFISGNGLQDCAREGVSEAELQWRFSEGRFSEDTLADLRVFLNGFHGPLAVRSSGLLEDAPYQPLAGVYDTFMLPNAADSLELRLGQLVHAIKRVYASVFSPRAKAYLSRTSYRLEEEMMAVILQHVVGTRHEDRFYPDFAGVARSQNHYPTPPLKTDDGIAAVALGFGRTVVDGDSCMRFSPRHPAIMPGSSAADDLLRDSQREFWALDLGQSVDPSFEDAGAELSRFGLHLAERDGTLAAVGSTYSPDNDSVTDGIARSGVRLVTFAPILKHGVFPLAEILRKLLDLGERGTSGPVEIEFAARLARRRGEPSRFGFLQLRPLDRQGEGEDVAIGHVLSSRLVCRSDSVLGNGRIEDLRDIVIVDRQNYDRSRSVEVADEIARMNARLQREGAPYLLIGAGRWGSNDPHLGIPVAWNQIAGARVIVETGFRDFKVQPSQGTHFFQNLTSCNVGYFTVNPEAGEGVLDWDWLRGLSATREASLVRHVRLPGPLKVLMSGRTGEGVILKPESEDP